MSNAVLGAIVEGLKNIELVFDETDEAFRKDRTQTAEKREITVKEFFESF